VINDLNGISMSSLPVCRLAGSPPSTGRSSNREQSDIIVYFFSPVNDRRSFRHSSSRFGGVAA
jgi:hypothetical protein